MGHFKTKEINDNNLKKYNEKEFYELIDFIDNKVLIEPIKKKSKFFAPYIKGFRVDKLDKSKLKDIYFKCLYKKQNPLLEVTISRIIDENAINVLEILESKLEDTDDIKKMLLDISNNKEYLDKVIDILLETRYGENIILSFKFIDIDLDEPTISYIEEKIKYHNLIKEEKKKVINNITLEFNEKLREQEKGFNEIIKNKEKEIKDLSLSIDNNNKKFAIEIKNKEIEILKLKEKDAHKERKFNLEYEKQQLKIVELNKNLENSVQEYMELKKLSDKKIDENNRLLSLLDDKYSKYDEYAKSRWENENKKLLSKSKEVDDTIQELKVQKQLLEEELSILKTDKDSVESAINLLENNSKEFIDKISYVINRIGRNEVIKITENKTSKDRHNEVSKINHVLGLTIEEEPEIEESKFDFMDDLADNLKFIGIGNEYIYELAKYIYATIANKMGLLVMGYNNRLFANALSYLISNSSADTLVVPPGFTDSKELIDKVNNTKSKVVLIENAIDNIAESVYMPLIKENKDKILILSMESNENINIIPKGIFNYLMVIDLDPILECDQTEELYTSITPSEIFSVEKNNKEKGSKLLNGLNSSLDLGNFSKRKMVEVNNIINNLNSAKDEGIYCLLLFAIGIISKNQNKEEQLYKFIKEQNFDGEKLDIIKSVIGMDNIDE